MSTAENENNISENLLYFFLWFLLAVWVQVGITAVAFNGNWVRGFALTGLWIY